MRSNSRSVTSLSLFPPRLRKIWGGNLSWSYDTKLNNWPTIWFTPCLSKTWHIFISSKRLHQICPVFNFVRKKTCLADARHTLVAAGSQKHFIYVWMAAGAQFCLAQTVCCGLWQPLASLLSPWHTLSLSLLGLCSVCVACACVCVCVCVYVCICMCLEPCMYAVSSCLHVLWTHFLHWISHQFFMRSYLRSVRKGYFAPLIRREEFLKRFVGIESVFWKWS